MNAEPTPGVTVTRDCPGLTVPAGAPTVLRAGTTVQVTQALGASVTVQTHYGPLVRVDRADADALGLDPGTFDDGDGDSRDLGGRRVSIAGTRFSMAQVDDVLHTVYDPEIPIDIVELGLVYRCEEEVDAHGRRRIAIDLTMTAPGCGMGDVLRADVARRVGNIPGVDDVEVTIVLDPPWGYHRLSDAARLQLGFL